MGPLEALERFVVSEKIAHIVWERRGIPQRLKKKLSGVLLCRRSGMR